MEQYLAKDYLKIIKEGKEYDLGDFYNKFKDIINFDIIERNDYFVGLPHDINIKYKGKEYDYEEYKKYIDNSINIQFLANITLKNYFLKVIFQSIYFQHQHARYNLIKTIPLILNNFSFNWEANYKSCVEEENGEYNKLFYVGMYGIRSLDVISAVIAYSHMIDKLYLLLYLTLKREEITSDNFKDLVKVGIEDVRIEYKTKINNASLIQGIKKKYYENFYNEIAELDKIESRFNLRAITNQFKHKGLFIEKGMKYSMWDIKKDGDMYTFGNYNIYDNSNGIFLEYDLDKVIKGLIKFDNKLQEIINKEVKEGLLKELQLNPYGNPDGYKFTK